ncbi:AAWKG family protein [Streptomyces broussonetiae]|uniref:AAWKG family protein n=1 Tax=Streptomyces broussonetiae TaxID=2686304 RepID=UPI0035DCBF34
MAVDNWENTINQVTGWHMNKRDTITGIHGGSGSAPWVEIAVKARGKLDSTDDFLLHQEMLPNGWHMEFFAGRGGSVHKYQVTITYADLTPGSEYWVQSETALSSLLQEPFTSIVTGSSVPGAPSASEGVDLRTFPAAAASFDLAGDFFKKHTQILKEWTDHLGSEQAAWKGNAAGVFWHLLDDLQRKYEGYTAQLQPPGFSPKYMSPSTGKTSTTLHGDDLIGAEAALHKAYQDLYNAYYNFFWQRGSSITVRRPDGSTPSAQIPADPRDILNQVYAELADWIGIHNAPHVHSHRNRFGQIDGATTDDSYTDETSYGHLVDTSHWAAAAQEAVKRWTTNIETNLDAPARTAVDALQQGWSRVLDPKWNSAFSFSDTSNSSLSKEVSDEAADKNGNDLNNAFSKINDGLNNSLSGMSNGINNLGDGLNNGLKNLSDGLGGGLNNGLKDLSDGLNHGLAGPDGKSLLDGGGASLTGPGGMSLTGPNGTSLTGPDGMSLTGPNGTSVTGPKGTSFTGPNGTSLTAPDFSPVATGFPISNINGSSTTFRPSGISTTTFPNGHTTTRNADGSLTTRYPDGTSRTVSPNGDVTTVDARGHSTTSHLAAGHSLTNPDGTKITRNVDGSLTQTGTDGSKTTTFANGTSEIVGADGHKQITSPDGIVSHLNRDGSLTTDFPGHGSTTVHPNGDVTTTDAGGHRTTSHLSAGHSITNPDGTTVSVDSKGDIITHYRDGSTSTLHPDGKLTMTQAPADHGSGPNLNGNSNIPHYPSVDTSAPNFGRTITHLPGGGSVTTHPDGTKQTVFSDGSSLITSSDGNYQTLPSPATAAQAAAAGAAAVNAAAANGASAGAAANVGALSDSQNAMGLLSPMMMMGMNRMGGQQGGGSGERNRDTYEDRESDGAFMHSGMTAARTAPTPDPEEYEEEESDSEELLAPRRHVTESPFGQGGASRASTQTSSSWNADDEDVWGTKDGGLPASIGH